MTAQRIKAKVQTSYNQMPHWLNCRTEINQNAKAIYSTLWGYGFKSGRYFAGLEKLAKDTGMKRLTVITCIKSLIKHGLIQKDRRGNRRANEYYFIADHIWETEWVQQRDETYAQVKYEKHTSDKEIEILKYENDTSDPSLKYEKHTSLINKININKKDSNDFRQLVAVENLNIVSFLKENVKFVPDEEQSIFMGKSLEECYLDREKSDLIVQFEDIAPSLSLEVQAITLLAYVNHLRTREDSRYRGFEYIASNLSLAKARIKERGLETMFQFVMLIKKRLFNPKFEGGFQYFKPGTILRKTYVDRDIGLLRREPR